MKVADGVREWTRSYTAGGTDTIIYNECWGGVLTSNDEIITACGTGIEGTTCCHFEPSCATCNGVNADANGNTYSCCANSGSCMPGATPANFTNCMAGRGDPRPGAMPRKPGTWQSLVIKTDSSGSRAWQRVDSYRAPGSLAMIDNSTWEAAAKSSAAEWVLLTKNGNIVRSS